MTYRHAIPHGRGADPAHDAAIARALAGGKITEWEVGVLRAAAMYGTTENAAKAREALATPKKKRRP